MLDHPTAPLGPPKGPVFAQKGPFGRPGHPLGPELFRTATGWSNWVGCINIMCLGLLRELYCTPRVPKRARWTTLPHPWGLKGGCFRCFRWIALALVVILRCVWTLWDFSFKSFVHFKIKFLAVQPTEIPNPSTYSFASHILQPLASSGI